jgi:hypothetical protein
MLTLSQQQKLGDKSPFSGKNKADEFRLETKAE